MRLDKRALLSAVGTAVICLAGSSMSRASLTEISSFSASGTNPASGDKVSATATFYFDPSHPKGLIIDLVNTSDFNATHPQGGKLGGSDVLVGLAFNISGNPAYAASQSSSLTPRLTLDGGAGPTSTVLVNKKGDSSLTDTWTDDRTKGGKNKNSNVTGAYGISTNGFGGAFKGRVGGPNDGIVGPGNSSSTVAGGNGKGKGTFPLAMNGLEFTLTFKTRVSDVTLSNVQFLFGTEGTGVLNGIDPHVVAVPEPHVVAVPEPSTMVMAALGALGFLGHGLRRRPKT